MKNTISLLLVLMLAIGLLASCSQPAPANQPPATSGQLKPAGASSTNINPGDMNLTVTQHIESGTLKIKPEGQLELTAPDKISVQLEAPKEVIRIQIPNDLTIKVDTNVMIQALQSVDKSKKAPVDFNFISALLAALLALFGACLTGYLAYRAANKARFTNLVTAERLKWIVSLRGSMCKFCGAVELWRVEHANLPTSTPQSIKLVREINDHYSQIRLLLDARYTTDRSIELSAKALFDHVQNRSVPVPKDWQADLDALINKTRAHLNVEWQKVKEEAKDKMFPELRQKFRQIVQWMKLNC